MTQVSNTIIRTFKAPQKLVFSCFTEQKHLREWLPPNGYSTAEMEADPTTGGKFSLVFAETHGEVANSRAEGHFSRIEPYTLVEWEHEIFFEGGSLKNVTAFIQFEATGADTKVTITLGHPNPDVAAGAQIGWAQSLDKLAELLLELQS